MPTVIKGGSGGPGLPNAITGIAQIYAGGGGGTNSFGGRGGGGSGNGSGAGGDGTYYGSGGGGAGSGSGTGAPGGTGYQGVFIVSYPISIASYVGSTPLLTSMSPFVFSTTIPGQTFTVYQSATNTGPIKWSYNVLPNGVTILSQSISQIVFKVSQNSSAVAQKFYVKATGQYGSTTIALEYTAT